MEASTAPGPTEAATAVNVGYIEEIQGVVIEAVFHDKLPEINHAITVPRASGAGESARSIAPHSPGLRSPRRCASGGTGPPTSRAVAATVSPRSGLRPTRPSYSVRASE